MFVYKKENNAVPGRNTNKLTGCLQEQPERDRFDETSFPD